MTSPTPYDPPLSYGGWLQSRALGVRISSLLQAPEFVGTDAEALRSQSPASDDGPTIPQPTPSSLDAYHRYNVIIHTSPYLRCLQTAIAISAGLNQQLPETESSDSASSESRAKYPIPDPRTLLRVDAFLGEWLSPDYYVEISHPPGSDRMVASAKAELVRRGETIATAGEGARVSSGHFPGGWLPRHAFPSTGQEDRRLPAQAPSATPIQTGQRQRASTYDTTQNPTPSGHGSRGLDRQRSNLPSILDAAYVPPTPGYAVSVSDPIPAGYVAHARDACTKIDYQWDSMRTPFWGTGGEFGEEWSHMHERVHAGFRRMLDWYRRQDELQPEPQVVMSNGATSKQRPAQTVLIIVTHGADCNALISCLAGHSMLLDINTASLTMAVRRNRLNSTTPDLESAPSSPRQRDDRSVSEDYALQLVASSDHLRAGANPLQLTSLTLDSASQPLPPPPIPIYRNRLGSRPSTLQGSFTIGPTPGSMTSSRSWSLASRPSTATSNASRGVSGLWGSLSSPTERDDEDVEEDFVPNFGDPRPVSRGSTQTDSSTERVNWTSQLPQRNVSQRGLWGSAASLEDRDRDLASRRRWTVAEQKL